ncbi:MAG: hypothetical protein HZB43_01320 [candidate division Zixibacteria bacterium]|nr:hypothetical protein [candidate division Zixibacteria bacterium]
MNSRSRRAGSIRNGVLCGCLMVALTGALTARAQDLDSTRIYVVIPESERPLGFGVDSGQSTTTYPCLDSLNRAWDFLDIYKPFNHRGNILDGIYTVVFSDSMNLDTVEAAFRASGCLNDAYRMAVFQLYSTPNDSLFSHVADTTVRQWGLDGAHTRAQQAWDITTGDSQIGRGH